jgi:hypothetical protein
LVYSPGPNVTQQSTALELQAPTAANAADAVRFVEAWLDECACSGNEYICSFDRRCPLDRIAVVLPEERMNKIALAVAVSVLVVSLAPSMAHAQLPTGNLLTNPDAETGSIAGWTVITGAGPESVSGADPAPTTSPGVDNGTFDPGIDPLSGSYDFLGEAGGSGNGGASGQLTQDVSLAGISGVTPALIDSGVLTANVSFAEQGLDQGTPSDEARVALQFLDASSNILETVSTPYVDSHNGTWKTEDETFDIPAGTSTVAYSMFFLRNQGSDLDAFVDDNSLIVSDQATTPEPGSVAFCGMILAGLAGIAVRRRRQCVPQ